MHKLLYSTLLIGSVLSANTVVPSNGSDLKITIYNSNMAFINDTRSVSVNQGKQKLVYEGVPSSVITQSVVPTFSGMMTNLYSQNYIYDLISLNSMLVKSIDKEVSFFSNGENPTLSKGILLSASPRVMVQESDSGEIFTLNSGTQVIFSKIPSNMITKPSLVWNLETEKSGKLGIDLKYLTRGISWKSDYVLNLTKDDLDLTGWITVTNNSGVTYDNAQITCLAGDVNRVAPRANYGRVMRKAMPMMEAAADVAEESFSGYHIYKIPFKETISNKQQKQISFIGKKGVKYHQYGINTNTYFENYGKQKLVFTKKIEFENSKENHMGIALPSGVVRMYQKDSSEQTHFIGESRIGNIPEDEKVKLTVGTLFDAVGEKTITKFIAKRHYRNVVTRYNVRNQGKEPLELRIQEQIPVYGQHIKVKSSCTKQCSESKKNAFMRTFTIQLAPKEKYIFTSEFEVNY